MNKLEKIKSWSLEDINAIKIASTEWLCVEKNLVVLVDVDYRVKRVWEKKNSHYEEVNVKEMAKRIASYLSKHVSLESLLKDKILHEPAETLLDLDKRVLRKGKVKEHKGCYSVSIAGKRGPALELEL